MVGGPIDTPEADASQSARRRARRRMMSSEDHARRSGSVRLVSCTLTAIKDQRRSWTSTIRATEPNATATAWTLMWTRWRSTGAETCGRRLTLQAAARNRAERSVGGGCYDLSHGRIVHFFARSRTIRAGAATLSADETTVFVMSKSGDLDAWAYPRGYELLRSFNLGGPTVEGVAGSPAAPPGAPYDPR
jgi:hypothetical protein